MGVYIWNDTWLPNKNTVLYLPLKSDLIDHSGNNIALTNNGVVIEDGVGKFNNASFSYDSITTYLSATPFTINVWVKQNSYLDGAGLVCGHTKIGSSRYGWNVCTVSNAVRMESIGGGTNIFSNTISNGQWYFISCIFDNSNKSIYENGVLVSSGASTINSFRDRFRIGVNDADTGISPRYFNGYMSNIIIENKARTAEQVAGYYNQTKSQYGIS